MGYHWTQRCLGLLLQPYLQRPCVVSGGRNLPCGIPDAGYAQRVPDAQVGNAERKRAVPFGYGSRGAVLESYVGVGDRSGVRSDDASGECLRLRLKIIPRGLWLTRDDGVLLFLVLFQQIGR